jgi:hypothetical protein
MQHALGWVARLAVVSLSLASAAWANQPPATTTAPSTTAPATTAPATTAPTVFLAPLRASALDADARAALEDALLVALRERGLRVVGSVDLRGLLEVDAVRQASGCDADSCAAEVADALGAPEIVTCQIARLGDRWVFTLARLSRGDLVVRARAQRTLRGSDASVLLDIVPDIVREIVPNEGAAAGPSPGLMVTGTGVVVGLLGGILWGVSAGLYSIAESNLKEGQPYKQVGEPLYYAGIIVTAAGVLVAGVGAGLWLTAEAP